MKPFLRSSVALASAIFLSYSYAQSAYNTEIPKNIMTPDTVKIDGIGTLKFFDGFPDAVSTKILYNNLYRSRAMEAFINFIPMASAEAMRAGLVSAGATSANKIILFQKLMDSNSLFLTGNTDTVYALAVLDLQKGGPIVVEIPPGAGPGTVNDAYFRFVVDMGGPGPDKGKGGKYLILPPGYKGEVPEGYFVARSRTYINLLALRGLMKDGSPDPAAQMWKNGLKVYPLSKASAPPAMQFINATHKVFNTIHSNKLSFFTEINTVIQREPIAFLDPELRGNLASLGIEKGKPFSPDAHMKHLLTQGVKLGNATARAFVVSPPSKKMWLYGSNSAWFSAFDAFENGSYRWLINRGRGGRNQDARARFFYIATVNTPAMVKKMIGIGSQYALAVHDSNHAILDGSKNYKLTIPGNVPAKNFWSVVVYDPQTRSMLQTSQPYPSKNSVRNKDMQKNADGSVTLWFGPQAPAGKQSNWIQTVPGKAWFICLRLYGPLQPWFDKKWRPGEIEPVDSSGEQ